MTGLGRVPKGFKDSHVCGKCGVFAPLWDMSYGKWCDDCVRSNGGLLKAGEIAREQWRAAAEARRTSKNEINAWEQFREKVRDLATWKRAQALHKAMRCTPEEAYEQLLKAEARKHEPLVLPEMRDSLSVSHPIT